MNDPEYEQPSHYAKELVTALVPHVCQEIHPGNQRLALINAGIPVCYLILDGEIAVHRMLDDLLVLTLKSPTLVGIGNLQPKITALYLKTINECTLGVLPVEKAHQIISEQNLWETLSQHMMVVTAHIFVNSQQLTAPSAYEIIRYQLLELMKESDTFRLSITAEKYIRDKTHLSRSGVLKILSELRRGNFIEIQNGILLKINKLPAKY